MTKQKVGLILFWIAVIWAIAWGVVGSFVCNAAMNKMTMEELNQSAWALTGPLMMLWGLFGVPLGAIVAMIGMLLYSGAKGSTIWKSGLGVFIGVAVGIAAMSMGHIRLLFGIGGSLILFFFIGIIWFWGKERMALKETSTTAVDLKLFGYVFLLIGAWFTCGGLGLPFLKANEGTPPATPINIMIFLVLGWLFLFLSHYKSRKQ